MPHSGRRPGQARDGLDEHVAIAGGTVRFSAARSFVGPQGLDDGPGGGEEGRELAHGPGDGLSHEDSGAIDGIEEAGEHGIDAAGLVAGTGDYVIGSGLHVGGLIAQGASEDGEVGGGFLNLGGKALDKFAGGIDDGHDGRAKILHFLSKRAGKLADGDEHEDQNDGLNEKGQGDHGDEDELQGWDIEFRHRITLAQGFCWPRQFLGCCSRFRFGAMSPLPGRRRHACCGFRLRPLRNCDNCYSGKIVST